MGIEDKERCGNCEYVERSPTDDPCSECCHEYVSKFEPERTMVTIEVRKLDDIISKIDQMTIGMNVWPSDIVKMLKELTHSTKEVK